MKSLLFKAAVKSPFDEVRFMTTLATAIDYLMATDGIDQSAHGRLQFWLDTLGQYEMDSISEDMVDDAIVGLQSRGRLKAGRGIKTERTGKPLAPATISRYLSTLGSIYRFAKRQRLIKRGTVTPTAGLEKPTSPIKPDKYCTPEQIETLIKSARVVDRQWGKMAALIRVGFTTGMRVGSITGLRWKDVDLDAGTAFVACTKNGDPHVAALSDACIAELRKLPKSGPEALIFGGRTGQPYAYRKLFDRVAEAAGMPEVTFHWIRHSCGSALASSGRSQGQVMAVMGHRTLTASARYMHSNVSDRRAAIEGVFA